MSLTSPLAVYQNMPPLAVDEYSALEASIREHGVQVPILLDEKGVVIDGHHRQKIASELGIPCPHRTILDLSETEKRTLALTLNLDRRHLSREQRRALIVESLKADPQLSNRQHAERVGVSDKTVGSVRTALEARAELPHVEKRLDSLGRKQLANRSVSPGNGPYPSSPRRELPTAEEVERILANQLTWLKKRKSPYLAEIEAGTKTIPQAFQAERDDLDRVEEAERMKHLNGVQAAQELDRSLLYWGFLEYPEARERTIQQWHDYKSHVFGEGKTRVTPAHLRTVSEWLSVFADELEQVG